MTMKERCDTCPFAYTEASEQAQNYGCLPTPADIVSMRIEHGRTWACHDEPDKPCQGTLDYLRQNGLPHKVLDKALVTEKCRWDMFIKKAS